MISVQQMQARKPTPRRGRPSGNASKDKLANLLSEAQAQFIRHGYRAVTMRRVADQAHVSTRTLYNHFPDKLSLFRACLEQGSLAFPLPDRRPDEPLENALCCYAIALVAILSQDSSLKLGLLVYRDGGEFPDMVAAAEDNQNAHVVRPLARFLDENGFTSEGSVSLAHIFVAMAIAEWNRCMTFGHAMPDLEEMTRHCTIATRIFIEGVRPNLTQR